MKKIEKLLNRFGYYKPSQMIQPTIIDQEKEIEKVKADLCKILDSYSGNKKIGV